MQVVGCHPEEYAWLCERAGCTATPDMKAIKAVDDEGRIHGMVGYTGWTANAVVMHFALDNPAALRQLLQWGFRYPFEQCGRGVALATVREKNTRSMKVCRKIGFEEIFRVKDGVEVGEDMVLLEMRKERCPWLPRKVA